MTDTDAPRRGQTGWWHANAAALAARGFPLPSTTDVSFRVDTAAEHAGDVVTFTTPDGRRVPFSSDQGLQVDAARMADAVCRTGAPPFLIVIGAGFGHVIEALADRCPGIRMLVLEPAPCTLPGLLDRRDWRSLIDAGRLVILPGPDYAGADARQFLDDLAGSPPVFVHPYVRRAFPKDTAAARQIVRQLIFAARANLDARSRLAGRYLLNTLRNLPAIAAESDVTALSDAMRGVPAIVVAAGPSLDADIHDIIAVNGRAVIIAVDTALRPLLRANLAPHFVVTVDPSEINGRHLRHLPDVSRTWLVAEGSADRRVFEQFAGRAFVFQVSDHHPWPWLREFGIGRGVLKAWGSVTVSAADLAVRLGCNPIVFTGADLAYPGSRTYCRGTTFESEWGRRVALGRDLPDVWCASIDTRSPVDAADLNGRPVQTTPTLLAFRDAILGQVRASSDRDFVNGTRSGTLWGSGIRQARVTSVLGQAPELGDAVVREAIADAWQRGTCAASQETLRAARAEVGGGNERLIQAWLEFSSGGVTAAEILDAVLDTPERGTDEPTWWSWLTPSRKPAALHPPEQLALLRAESTRGPWPAWVPRPPASRPGEDPRSLDGLLDSGLRALGRLVETATPDVSIEKATRVPDVPASFRYRWPPALIETVVAVEEAVSEALWRANGAALGTDVSSFWRRTAPAVAPAVDACGDPTDSSAKTPVPVLAVAAVWLKGVRTVSLSHRPSLGEPKPGTGLDRIGLLSDIIAAHPSAGGYRALVGVQIQPAPPHDDTPGVSVVSRGVISPEHWARLTTGTLTRRRTEDAPDQASFDLLLPGRCRIPVPGFASRARWHIDLDIHEVGLAGPFGRPRDASDVWDAVEPILPMAGKVARAGNPWAVGDGTVLVAGRSTSHSWHIDARGEVRPGSSWPGPIAGELPYGNSGGAIAWDPGDVTAALRPDPSLWIRETESATPERVGLPFRPMRGIRLEDGRYVWNCPDGGLGLWSRDGGASVLFSDHVFAGMVVRPDGLLLYPAQYKDRVLQRTGSRHYLLWNMAGSTVTAGPRLDTAGPCSSEAVAGPWSAACHVLASVVRLLRCDGQLIDLTCPEPVQAAWAGPSLAVLVMTGDVLLFPELASILDEHLAAS